MSPVMKAVALVGLGAETGEKLGDGMPSGASGEETAGRVCYRVFRV